MSNPSWLLAPATKNARGLAVDIVRADSLAPERLAHEDLEVVAFDAELPADLARAELALADPREDRVVADTGELGSLLAGPRQRLDLGLPFRSAALDGGLVAALCRGLRTI